MSSASVKSSSSMAPIPKTLLSIAVFLGGLAMFLFVASVLLVTHPIGSKIRGYFYGVDTSNSVDLTVVFNQSAWLGSYGNNFGKEASSESLPTVPGSSDAPPVISEYEEAKDQQNSTTSVSPDLSVVEKTEDGNSTGPATEDVQLKTLVTSASPSNSGDSSAADESAPFTDDAHRNPSPESGCDLNHGSWFYDPSGPLYTNNSCPVITQMQNCQGNGRPDKEYENWRWRPSQCELPRFDAKKFLELMSGKTLAFIGDSVARNQMESLLCILWQVEVPKNRGNKRMQRWYFRSKSVMIVRFWSSWLVHQSSEPLDFAPEGVTKIHLDVPDKNIMEFLPSFDVVVLSSGHWFAKQSAYVLNNEIVGGQLWWPDKSRPMKVNNVEAFGISVETILSSIAMHPNFTGLAILRSFSPDHYEGGEWNTGGSCTGKVRPLESGNLVENGFTNVMHMKQVTGFDLAMKKANNKAKLRLMDITESFGYRHDGHPGPYRSPDPNKITKRGPDGRPPPQDCLHWCMPGPVDTWNEMVLEIIRREYESS